MSSGRRIGASCCIRYQPAAAPASTIATVRSVFGLRQFAPPGGWGDSFAWWWDVMANR